MPGTGPRLRAAVTVEQAWHPVPGGTATSVLRTLAAQRRQGDVDLVGVAARHAGPPAEEFRPPVPVAHLPLPRQALYPAWQRLRWPPVTSATGPVDVVHATTFAVPPKRGPLVVTVHDLAFLHAPEHFTARGNRFFRRGLALVRDQADVVLVPSRDTWDDCVRAGIEASRLRLVPHGVEVPAVAADDVADARRRYGLDRDYVLWVGTREPRKNLDRLLAAFGALSAGDAGVDLVLAGPAGWGRTPDAGTPPDGVRPLGFVPDADLHALYAGARAFAYPSLREGFGMPVLEALAHGVPVVTSAGTPMAGLAGPAGIAVDPLDTDAIAGALTAALGARHDELSAAARDRAAGHTWQRSAALTTRAYRDACGRAAA